MPHKVIGHQKQSDDPIAGINPRDAPPRVTGEARRVTEIAIMNVVNNKAAEDEEKIDAGVPKAEKTPERITVVAAVEHPAAMNQNDEQCRYPARSLQCIQPFVASVHGARS